MDDIEQYSDQSRAALTEAARQLVEQLEAHTSYLLGLRGGTAELMELFDRQEGIATVARAWNDAVFDHTGTSALNLDDPYDEEDDEDREDEDDEEPDGEVVSVVSRFDLRVVDEDAVRAAGREAHRRLWPQENEADALAAVPRVADALYSIRHEAGEAWFDIPGIEPIAGARVFLAVDETYEPPHDDEDDDDEPLAEVAAPDGTVIRSEGWRFGG
jgi:hypothetical protein